MIIIEKLKRPIIPKRYTELEMMMIKKGMRILENEYGDKFMVLSELHKFMMIKTRVSAWMSRRTYENGFADEDKDYYVYYTNGNDIISKSQYESDNKFYEGLRFKMEVIVTSDLAKKICMAEKKNPRSEIIKNYFLLCEKWLHEKRRKFELFEVLTSKTSREDDKVKALAEYDEIIRLEEEGFNGTDFTKNPSQVVTELRNKAMKRNIIDERDIKKVTTVKLHEYLSSIGLGTYGKVGKEKKRCFQTNEEYELIVASKGLAMTGTTNKGNKSNIVYSIDMIDWMEEYHLNDYITYCLKK